MGVSGSLVRESQVDIYVWRHGEDEWSQEEFESNLPFQVGCNNPVFHEGLFYCLGREGNLGVYNPEEETWTVLDRPRPLFSRRSNCLQGHDCFLVESAENKELMSVFVFNDGERVTVSRLDESKMAWRNVDDLGDEMIFVDARSSISVVSPSKETGNRIYLPRFSDGAASRRGGGVYYSLKTKKLHTHAERDAEQVRTDCVWVMPSF
ncbi:F-box/kelch-repeat protein At1g57790-like [Asparagus officinalis]|nr:F-box/kelch-repeat protein At1g57790-like [Asparagus officinalis]